MEKQIWMNVKKSKGTSRESWGDQQEPKRTSGTNKTHEQSKIPSIQIKRNAKGKMEVFKEVSNPEK